MMYPLETSRSTAPTLLREAFASGIIQAREKRLISTSGMHYILTLSFTSEVPEEKLQSNAQRGSGR